MKKLMIAAAIVCAAVVANAATANWSVSAQKIYSGDGKTTGYSGSGFMFDSGVTSQSALYSLIMSGEVISSKTAGYAADISVSEGTLTATKYAYGEQGSGSVDFYMVLIESDKVYFSNIKNVTKPSTDTAKAVLLGSQNNNTTTFSDVAPTSEGFQGSGYWSQTVPEPTSGLLLLLGVAGLALKRKRA